MEYEKFRSEIIPQIKSELHDWVAVLQSYEDIINICSIAESICDNTNEVNFFKLVKEKDRQASLYLLNHHKLITLLKALYLFCSIFINRLLIEITKDKKITLWKFVHDKKYTKNNSLYKDIDLSKILSAYCIIVIRNKLLAHHEMDRGVCASFNGIKSCFRFYGLSYVDSLSEFSPSEIQRIQVLRDKYIKNFQTLSSMTNYYEISEYLFYNIPIDAIGAENSDRKDVDKIIEKSGVRGYSFNKIIDSVDEFIYEIARLINSI